MYSDKYVTLYSGTEKVKHIHIILLRNTTNRYCVFTITARIVQFYYD